MGKMRLHVIMINVGFIRAYRKDAVDSCANVQVEDIVMLMKLRKIEERERERQAGSQASKMEIVRQCQNSDHL